MGTSIYSSICRQLCNSVSDWPIWKIHIFTRTRQNGFAGLWIWIGLWIPCTCRSGLRSIHGNNSACFPYGWEAKAVSFDSQNLSYSMISKISEFIFCFVNSNFILCQQFHPLPVQAKFNFPFLVHVSILYTFSSHHSSTFSSIWRSYDQKDSALQWKYASKEQGRLAPAGFDGVCICTFLVPSFF